MGGLESISLNSTLIDHIKNSNLEGCQSVLSQGADVNADFNGKSALRLSLERGDPRIFELLHLAGGEIRPVGSETALHIAVGHSQVALVKHLLRTQPSLKNIKNGEGKTALHLACSQDNQELIALLLKYNAQPSLKDSQGVRASQLGGLLEQFSEDELQVRSPSSSQRAVSAKENTHASSTFYTDFEKSTILENAIKNSKIPVVRSADLEVGEMLSRGSSSTVYRGRWRGSEVAVKKFKQEYSENTKDILKFIKEMQVLDQVRHPNILLLMGICVDKPHLCLISELAIHGSLFKVLHRNKLRVLSFEEKHGIAIQITQGLVYLHSCDPPIVHRDLKPENCLLDSAFNVKIADFGLARPASWFMEEGQKSSVCIGTTRFMAPELFDRGQIHSFGPKIDVWALGCIFIELYSGRRPWGYIPSSNSDKIFDEIFQRKPVPLPHTVPEPICNIISQCCEYDVNNRATAAEVLEMLISIS